MTTIKPLGRIALRLSEEDAAALKAIARDLARQGRMFVSMSDVLRHALRVAAAEGGEPGADRG